MLIFYTWWWLVIKGSSSRWHRAWERVAIDVGDADVIDLEGSVLPVIDGDGGGETGNRGWGVGEDVDGQGLSCRGFHVGVGALETNGIGGSGAIIKARVRQQVQFFCWNRILNYETIKLCKTNNIFKKNYRDAMNLKTRLALWTKITDTCFFYIYTKKEIF